MKALLTAACVVGVLAWSNPAAAWKPVTHVALAEEALADALDDGKVALQYIDDRGRLKRLGTFKVSRRVLVALKRFGDHYRAGVLGPDAYPDLITGQMIVHPHKTHGKGSGRDKDEGSDAWLKYIWNRAWASNNPRAIAFALGYLTHAAGDMWAHTYVNNYAGGEFNTGNGFRNALKHVFLESYLGQTGPQPRGNVSIQGLEHFLYEHFVSARHNKRLAALFRRVEGNGNDRAEQAKLMASVPFAMSKLRAKLQCDIDRRQKQGYKIDPIGDLVIEYKKHWVADIDAGLKQWVKVNHQVAKAIMYNRVWVGGKYVFKADWKKAKQILVNYVGQHLLSMMGAPDVVGKFIVAAKAISEFVNQVLGEIVKPFKQLMDKVRNELLNFIAKVLFGKSVDELKAYWTAKATHFDRVMRMPGYPDRGKSLTLAELHGQHHLRTRRGRQWTSRSFDPAYNTVVMSKLVLLDRNELTRVMNAVFRTMKNPPRVYHLGNHIMFGFMRSLDKGGMWTNSDLLKSVYQRLFRKIPGGHDKRLSVLREAGRTKDTASKPNGTGAAPDQPCFRRNRAGGSCRDKWDCLTQHCVSGRCVPQLGRGSAGTYCNHDNQCTDGRCRHDARKKTRVCTALKNLGLGAKCRGQSQCASGRCDMGYNSANLKICVPRSSQGRAGDPCTSNFQCRQHKCTGWSKAGRGMRGVCLKVKQKSPADYRAEAKRREQERRRKREQEKRRIANTRYTKVHVFTLTHRGMFSGSSGRKLSVADCKKTCARYKRCRAFTFTPPKQRYGSARCAFYDKVYPVYRPGAWFWAKTTK